MVALSTFNLERVIPDVPKKAYEEFIDDCDRTTLFYAVFRSVDRKHVVFIGPPPYGFESVLKKAKFYLYDKRIRAKHRYLSRSYEIWVPVPEGEDLERIEVEMNGKRVKLDVQSNECNRFRGRRVIATLCKDTPVRWIEDWVRFHVVNHGANAVVIFENSSTPEHAACVHSALLALNLDLEVEVVHTPLKYGPPKVSDYKFLQQSLWQYVRWQYAYASEGYLSCDIDELIVCEDDISIFDKVKDSALGYCLIAGIWIEPVTDVAITSLTDLSKRRHHLFRWTKKPPTKTHRKWVAKPSKIPIGLQFKVHAVRPEPKYNAWLHPIYTRFWKFADAAYVCHFRSVNTSWRGDRTAISQIDIETYQEYEPLRIALERAIPDFSTTQKPNRQLELAD